MIWSTVRLWLAMLLLLALSVAGFWGLPDQWVMGHGFGAAFSNSAQTAYALLGLVAVFGLFRKAGWVRPLLWAWGVLLCLTGITASLVWSDQGAGAAAGAGVVMLASAALVYWLAWPASARR